METPEQTYRKARTRLLGSHSHESRMFAAAVLDLAAEREPVRAQRFWLACLGSYVAGVVLSGILWSLL